MLSEYLQRNLIMDTAHKIYVHNRITVGERNSIGRKLAKTLNYHGIETYEYLNNDLYIAIKVKTQ